MKKILSVFAVMLLGSSLAMASETVNSESQKVVLINTFEVAKGEDENVLSAWKAARDFLATQKGYINTRLHKNINPEGKFLYINVAEWESPAAFQAATQNMQKSLGNNMPKGTVYTPGLFKVVAE